jgi:hypothetical protein
MKPRFARGAALGVTGMLGCTGPAGPGPVRQLGFIGGRPDVSVIEAVRSQPLMAHTNVLFVVYSFGSSSCTEPDGVEVRRGADLIEVAPFDLVGPPPGTNACTDDLAAHAHDVTLETGAPGTLTLTARGRDSMDGKLVDVLVPVQFEVR